MKRETISSVVSLVLAAVVIAAGVGAVQLAERWLFPPAQPVYIPAESLPTAGIRFETDEALRLYPMNEYDPKKCIPAKETPAFAQGYANYREEQGAAPVESIDTSDLTYQGYKASINRLLCNAVQAFLQASEESGRQYMDFENSVYYAVDRMEYDESSGLFYLQDAPVTLDYWAYYYSTSYSQVPGRVTLAFYSDLHSYCEPVYFRFTPSSTQYYARGINETSEWLYRAHWEYRDNGGNWYDNPFVHAMDYAKAAYDRQCSDAAGWEALTENYSQFIEGNSVICVFSAEKQQLVLTYDPTLDTLTGFSLQTK